MTERLIHTLTVHSAHSPNTYPELTRAIEEDAKRRLRWEAGVEPTFVEWRYEVERETLPPVWVLVVEGTSTHQ